MGQLFSREPCTGESEGVIATLSRELNVQHVEQCLDLLIWKRQPCTGRCPLIRLPAIHRLLAASLVFAICHRKNPHIRAHGACLSMRRARIRSKMVCPRPPSRGLVPPYAVLASTRQALWPPKPKLFLSTRSILSGRASWGTYSRSQSGSGWSRLIVGGATWC
jgi:hypothetical protein